MNLLLLFVAFLLSSCADVNRDDPRTITGVVWAESLSSITLGASSLSIASSSSMLSSALSSAVLSPAVLNSSIQASSSAGRVDIPHSYGVVSGTTYKTIQIGSQNWMAVNLNDGIEKPFSVLSQQMYLGGEKLKACYGDVSGNCANLGATYQWAMAMNLPASCNITDCSNQIQVFHQGVCPTGWHIPTTVEFNVLRDVALAAKSQSPGNALKSIAGKTAWDNPVYNEANTLGFSANPSGIQNAKANPAVWDFLDGGVWFWTANQGTTSADSSAAYANLTYDNMNFPVDDSGDPKLSFFSVRCLQNP